MGAATSTPSIPLIRSLFLKVMAAARTSSASIVGDVIATQRLHLLHELRNLERLRRDPTHDVVVKLLLAAAARHVTADLSFLDDTEAALIGDSGAALASLHAPARADASREGDVPGRLRFPGRGEEAA
ncbi:MAG TPA: hypothetical protein VFC19_31945 [Candidatus Limnocylindrales bacterium]|nr:hypothetical protein [Candidatus Limnocylindrales bacterium]